MRWLRFSNGKIWPAHQNGWIKGAVAIPRYESYWNLEGRRIAIAKEIAGSDAGMPYLVYQHRGNGFVAFRADVTPLMQSGRKDAAELSTDSAELRNALKRQYPINDAEVGHLLSNADKEYGQESVLNVLGSRRQVRCPKDPKQCNYVRIVFDDLEIAYWRDSDWGKTPVEVMGAILDAARGRQHQLQFSS
jgi:hypothetical protein